MTKTPSLTADCQPPRRPCMNIAGCRTVNSRPERYTDSSTGRVLAWFTSESDGW
jgi:hypothetical protein